jgi:hypothetical protein
MKKVILSAILSLPLFASAQLVSDFTTVGGTNFTNEFGSSLSFNSGIATIGSGATADLALSFADIQSGPQVFTDGLSLTYIARIDAGNASNSFKIRFANDGGDYVYDAEVITTGWVVGQLTTGTVVIDGLLASSPVSFFTIAGDGTSSAFRMSFDNLEVTSSVIPEPSSYAALAGLAALGLVASRRRRSA